MASQFLRVAEIVLEQRKRPMSARELVDAGIEKQMLDSAGRTPWQTMKSKLSVDIRRRGPASKFVRTEPGRFFLRRLVQSEAEVFEAEPQTPPAADERILVFASQRLDAVGRFQGISPPSDDVLHELIGPSASYMDRLAAEQEDEYKQVLTYIMVRDGPRILMFERGTYSRVEDSLRGLGCVGFGGHVKAEDHDLTSVGDAGIRRSAARELSEELELPKADAERLEALDGLTIVGFLNDDSSPVGRRHFAVLFEYQVAESRDWNEPKRGEKSITQLRWVDDPAELALEQFEYWSQLCLRTFYSDASGGRPAYVIRRRRPLRPPHLLCVLGEIGSGKTETTKQLTADFGYVEINSGALLAELLGLPPITAGREANRLAFQRRAAEFISSTAGPGKLADALWAEVRSSQSDRVLVDGIRQRSTLNALRDKAEDWEIGLLYVYTPADVAFDFYRSRRGPDTTIHDFVAVREASVEQDVRDLIGEADAVLYNWAGKRGFRDMVRELMRELGTTRA